jgi:PAS domain S-box-containing protein
VTVRPTVNYRDEGALFDGCELIAQLSLEREILWVSSSLVELVGWEPLDVIGHNLDEFILSVEQLDAAWDVTRLASNETLDARFTLRHPDGTATQCRATLHPVPGARGLGTTVIMVIRGFSSSSSDADDDLDLYQLLAENISDVVSMTEGEGTISWLSPSVETLMGWPASEMVGHFFREYVVPEDMGVLESSMTKIFRGETVHFEIRLARHDGTTRWVGIVSHRVDLPGRDRARVAVWRDVNDAVEARNTLTQSQRDFRRVAENASDVVIQTGVKGLVEWVSPSVSTVLGWRSVDVLGKNVLELIAPIDAARAEAWQALVLAGEHVRAAQMRYRTAANESRWMAVRAQPLIDERTPRGIIMSLRDCHGEVVTRRALNTLSAASRALTRSDNEHELLSTMCQTAVNEGGYLLCWYARPSVEELQHFACVASSFEHRLFAESSNLSWSDDHDGRNPAGVAWHSGQTVVVNDRLNDNRFAEPNADARTRGFRATIALPVRCARVLDGVLIVEAPEAGSFDVSVVGVFEELAAQIGFGIERLRDRDRLLHSLSEQLLLSAAVNQSGESITITDPQANIIYANPSVLRSSGYELDELIGQNPRVFQSGLQNRVFYEAMWQQLSNGATWRGVLVNKRKNGELYEEEVTISPIHDETGRLTAYVAVKRDLTFERNLQANLTSDGNDRSTILEIMREMRPVSSLEAMANLFCRLVTRLNGIDTSTFFILHLNDTLSVMGQHGTAVFAASPPPSFPASVVAEQVHQGHPAAVMALDDERWNDYPEIREAIKSSGVQGAVVSPLRWNDSSIGVLVLATHDQTIAHDLSRRLPAFDQLGSYAGSFFGAQIETQRHQESLRSQTQQILDERAFTPVFQPFVELATGKIVGYEALTRFSNGRRPDLCIIDAHRAGLGPELEAACALASLEAAHDLDPEIWISLNFSPSALLGHYVEPVLAHANRLIVLEITEHDPIENYAAIRNVVATLPHCKLAVDDAGAGFTSLSHILELRPDYVKLDISIIRDIDTNPARQAMTAGMCHFAAQTNTIVIAEGVETQAEADTLLRLGISLGQSSHLLGQGYFFGRPVPLELSSTSLDSPTPHGDSRAQ